jgi:hypothetical protein
MYIKRKNALNICIYFSDKLLINFLLSLSKLNYKKKILKSSVSIYVKEFIINHLKEKKIKFFF